MGQLHPLQRRLLAEELVRRRRADEQQRYAASQRRGRIDPNPHQIDAVVFALRRIPLGGCILADEVGLGKTIEAGLVIAQLLAEGMRRVLLIVPKSLLGQWQKELFDLFGIEAREGRPEPEAFVGDGVFLVHRDFAGGVMGSSLLKSSDRFDLVVIDEAHEHFAAIYKRYDKEGNYSAESKDAKIADRVRSLLRLSATPVLLLTATPIQNTLTELWGLVQYVEPSGTLLGKLPTFRELFCEEHDRKIVAAQTAELRRRISTVLQRTLRRQAKEFLETPFVDRTARLVEYEMSPGEKALYDDVTKWLLQPYLCAFRGNRRRLLLIGFHRRMASSLRALSVSLTRVADRLREQVKDKRNAAPPDQPAILELARDLEEDFEDLEQVEGDTDEAKPPTLDRIQAELELVERFIRRADDIANDSKAKCLVDTVRLVLEREKRGESSGKVVVFTESLTTQDYLRKLLVDSGAVTDSQITLFRGQNDTARGREALAVWEAEVGRNLAPTIRSSPDVALRRALVYEFEKRSKVFISTEAGAKGLNLQFCDTLVNFDLPWNPQRIEQRIGRVHRYGQKRSVTVINFLARGNEAQKLTFEILSQKLDLFGKVLDASDAVLHIPGSPASEPLVSALGVDFEKELARIYSQARSIEEVTAELKALRETYQARRVEFDDEQARATGLIESRLDEAVRKVFRRYQDGLKLELARLDRDLERLVTGFLTAINAPFEQTKLPRGAILKVSPNVLLPEGLRDGGVFAIGDAKDLREADPLHLGHALVRAAVDEARRATERPMVVSFRPGGEGLPEALRSLEGRRGRLVLTRIRYHGFEEVDHLVATALVEGEALPLDRERTNALLTLTPEELPVFGPPVSVHARAVEDAVEDAVMDDQSTTTAGDQARFERMLEQLDRYVEDQVLLLRRERTSFDDRLEKALRRRESAVGAAARGQPDREIATIQREISRVQERLDRLAQREDKDYQTWRDKLHERRFSRPEIDRVIDVEFLVATRTEGLPPC